MRKRAYIPVPAPRPMTTSLRNESLRDDARDQLGLLGLPVAVVLLDLAFEILALHKIWYFVIIVISFLLLALFHLL